jgi:hypothetical protein
MKMRSVLALLAFAALSLPACDREDPTTVGAPLVENGSVRTFEVTLPASDFLVRDTSFMVFPPPLYSFSIIANTFEGVLNTHTIARYRVDPTLAVLDSAGKVVLDSVPKLLRARMIVHVDTVASSFATNVALKLYRVAENWDTAAVSWFVRQPGNVLWSQPGGTRGRLIDSQVYAGGDSLVFNVDTALIKVFRDSATTTGGIMITSETPGTRLRIALPTLQVDYTTSIGDSTVTTSTLPFGPRFISDVVPASASSDPRVGGAPLAYRSILEVRPDLKNVTVACPFTPTCRVRLASTSIAEAALMLQPVNTQPGYVPELPLSVLAYTLLPTDQIPLVRAPLGVAAGFNTFAPASFRGTAAAVPLNVTTFVRDLIAPIDTTVFNSRYLTLIPGGTATVGYATFAGQPQLRLRLSVAQEIQLP